MGQIPQSTIDDIRGRADIVEVVSGYLPLKKAGANYRALCPFHQEKTPSFNVNPAKQIFHCFGCGEGGNSISFVMKFEGVSFPEALKILANQYGIVIEEHYDKRQDEKEPLYRVMEAATKFYQQKLQNAAITTPVRQYIESRGISDEMVELFRIGYAPSGWEDLIKALTSKGFGIEVMERAGLCKPSSKGNQIDRFRDRLMFPISNLGGKVIAFGGRILDGDSGYGPKYLNSPETPIYYKSSVLYGLDLAKTKARTEETLVVVEGYMDVLALRKAGVENCVAVAGVAFTPKQAEAIKRACGRVVVMFDSDEAGLQASRKSIPVLLDQGLLVSMLSLPGAKDPDEFIKNEGSEKFNELLGQAPPFPQFIIETTLESANLDTVEGKSGAAREILPFLKRIKDRLERDQYLQILGEKIGMDKNLLMSEMRSGAGSGSPMVRQRSDGAPGIGSSRSQAERILIRILLDRPQYLDSVAMDLTEKSFLDQEHRSAFRLIVEAKSQGIENSADILNLSDVESINKTLTSIALDSDLVDEEDMEKAAVDCYRKLHSKPEGRLAILKEQVAAQKKNEAN